MQERCETVEIETENGPVIINKSDFDKDKHTIAGHKVSKKKAAKKVK